MVNTFNVLIQEKKDKAWFGNISDFVKFCEKKGFKVKDTCDGYVILNDGFGNDGIVWLKRVGCNMVKINDIWVIINDMKDIERF